MMMMMVQESVPTMWVMQSTSVWSTPPKEGQKMLWSLLPSGVQWRSVPSWFWAVSMGYRSMTGMGLCSSMSLTLPTMVLELMRSRWLIHTDKLHSNLLNFSVDYRSYGKGNSSLGKFLHSSWTAHWRGNLNRYKKKSISDFIWYLKDHIVQHSPGWFWIHLSGYW